MEQRQSQQLAQGRAAATATPYPVIVVINGLNIVVMTTARSSLKDRQR